MSKYLQYQAVFSAPFATLGLKMNEQFLTELDFIFEDIGQPVFQSELAESIADQINSYFKNPGYQFSIDIAAQGTEFQKSVWKEMQAIPCGARLTYGEVANELNSGPRAVGNACRKNPIPLIIPCHRIVGKNSLGGFAGQTEGQLTNIKQWLLNHESSKIS